MVAKQNQDWIVALIAVPRTGSNFLCHLLNHHPLITFYYEIFHPDKFYIGQENHHLKIIKYINHKYSLDFANLEDINLIKWIYNNPTQLLDILKKLTPKKYMGFKLFPDHLDLQTIETAIIKNRNIKKILIKRNLLDAYISHEIAIKTNKWNQLNTSGICISLSIENFAKWVDWAEQWYQFFENNSSLTKEKYFVLHYEDIHEHKTNTEKLIYLSNFLSDIGLGTSKKIHLPNVDDSSIIPRQDTREKISDKITNYQEFTEKAKDKGLLKYLVEAG
ncbi:MAG: sulfotransferase [Cyanobacteria bacterium P01_F01_bin.143]